jgi:hypothetical protein
MNMKLLITMACMFLVASSAVYFYLDKERQAEAIKADEQQKMSAVCPETQPGRKWASMKAMNEACRAQGYID